MNLFEFCLSFVYFLFWYCAFSSPSRKCVIQRNSFSILKQIDIPLELQSDRVWLTNAFSLETNFTAAGYNISVELLRAWIYHLKTPLISFNHSPHFPGNFISWCVPVMCSVSSMWSAAFGCYIADINLSESPNNRSHIILPLYTACFQR